MRINTKIAAGSAGISALIARRETRFRVNSSLNIRERFQTRSAYVAGKLPVLRQYYSCESG